MLRLLTFGGLSLVDDGVAVTGAASQRSRLALLALLATAGPAGVAREKVLACLWPESEEERARHALKQAVYALRRDLGSERAISGTATLCLDSTLIGSDVRDFEDAIARGDDATAVGVYAGPFLDGVFVRGSAEFDQWAGMERSRLERVHLDAVARLARSAEANGELTAAIQWWRRAAAAEPLSGRVALSLMRALAESGDVSAAIQHARVHDAMVRAELDAPADDAVTTLAEELRRGDWTPPVRAPRVAPGAPPTGVLGEASAGPATTAAATPPPMVLAAESPHAEKHAAGAVPVRRRSPLLLAAVGLMAMIAVAVGGALARDRVSSLIAPATVEKSSRRIVVAAFMNRTGDSTVNSVGEMAADYTVRSLLQADFEVVDFRTMADADSLIARTARNATATDRVAALARETGAATVITGSYYRHGDSLQFDAKIHDPSQNRIVQSIGPVYGPSSDERKVVQAISSQISAALAASDTSASASAASLIMPPSVEAFEHANRGWYMFFTHPGDTTAVFAELARALRFDTAYTAPRLMRAYILDVKENWRDLAAAVKELNGRRDRMGRVELEVLALFESDLRGDLIGRMRASRELLRLSPGSVDMSLLVAVSASYLHRPAEVLDVLHKSNPDRGINLYTPMYWAWRAEAEHSLGRFDEELLSARQLVRRFPSQLYGPQALARAFAARGDTAALRTHLRETGYGPGVLTSSGRTVALLGARELRAHGRSAVARPIFERVASMPPAADASRDDLSKHALALYETGELVKARAAYTSLIASDPLDVDALGRLASIAVRLGDSATTRQIDARLAAWSEPYALGRPTKWRAHIAALSGRPAEAIALIHRALEQGFRPMDLNIVTLHEEPDFFPLWKEPGFRDILRPHEGTLATP